MVTFFQRFTESMSPRRTRRGAFFVLAAADLAIRAWSATLQAEYVAWSTRMTASDTLTTIGEATAIAVPVVLAPLILSPVAYLFGHLQVRVDSAYVRLVSVAFVVASFVVYDLKPWLSVFVAALGYLILFSGSLRTKTG